MSDNLKIGLQYCMPKRLLTRLIGKLAGAKAGFVTQGLIKGFIYQYKIDMNEAKHSDPSHFTTFNEFFTRELKDGARPIVADRNTFCFPVDGSVSQCGQIQSGNLIQAKGQTFEAVELLGGDAALAAEFSDGQFCTIYLAPSDYHRVHMPCDATLRQMIYIPGELFSVNQRTAQNVPNLFARNERVVCIFDTPNGSFAQILVGATIVGSIETTWAGTVTPPSGASIYRTDYPADGASAIRFKKGDEMGRFQLGSTVINLFAKDAVTFDSAVTAGAVTRMGKAYAAVSQGEKQPQACCTVVEAEISPACDQSSALSAEKVAPATAEKAAAEPAKEISATPSCCCHVESAPDDCQAEAKTAHAETKAEPVEQECPVAEPAAEAVATPVVEMPAEAAVEVVEPAAEQKSESQAPRTQAKQPADKGHRHGKAGNGKKHK